MKANVVVGREIRFSAAHWLPNVPAGHKCSRMHGHSYRVAVEVRGSIDAVLGWVADFGELDRLLREQVHATCDHRLLNEIAGLENPTSERLAVWVGTRIAADIAAHGCELHAVTVWEGDGGGWARVEIP